MSAPNPIRTGQIDVEQVGKNKNIKTKLIHHSGDLPQNQVANPAQNDPSGSFSNPNKPAYNVLSEKSYFETTRFKKQVW